MKKIILLIIISALLIGIKLVFFNGNEDSPPGQKTPAKDMPVNVMVSVVKPEKLENIIFVSGTILANEEVDLVPEVPGKVSNIYLTEGGTAQKGELLVKINDSDMQAQLKKLKAQESLLQDKEGRLKKLYEISGISREEYETSLNSLLSIRADIDFTMAQIAKTEIRAPFSGIIGLKSVSEGSFVSSSSRIASLRQVDPVKIDFSVPEKYGALIRNGNMIRFTVEGWPDKFEGKIIAVEPQVDTGTRTIKARALCKNNQNKLLPGAFAKIEMVLNETEESILIPTQAVIPILKGYKVFVARDGIANEVKVLAGLRTQDRLQILEGLHAGDSVITGGTMKLKQGTLLNIISKE